MTAMAPKNSTPICNLNFVVTIRHSVAHFYNILISYIYIHTNTDVMINKMK